jgi:hypothetical protein
MDYVLIYYKKRSKISYFLLMSLSFNKKATIIKNDFSFVLKDWKSVKI